MYVNELCVPSEANAAEANAIATAPPGCVKLLIDRGSTICLATGGDAAAVRATGVHVDAAPGVLVGVIEGASTTLGGQYEVRGAFVGLDGGAELKFSGMSMHVGSARRSVLCESALWDLYGIQVRSEPDMVLVHVATGASRSRIGTRGSTRRATLRATSSDSAPRTPSRARARPSAAEY